MTTSNSRIKEHMTARLLTTMMAAALCGLSACVDLKEEKVTGVTTSHYSTAAGFEDLSRATYTSIREFYAQERGFTLTEFGTDIFTKGADGSYKYVNDYTPALNGGDANVRDVWARLYEGINTTNTLIGRAPGVAIDAKTKARRVAEARFMRALYYFILVQMFGDLHLTLEETKGVQTAATRTPVAKVYDAILADLLAAEPVLEVTTPDWGRATKGAAQHLLAKVYLTRAAAGDFAQSAAWAQKVIGSGQYSLLPSWASVFEFKNKRNAEVVWSVQYTSDPLANGPGNSGHLYFLMEYDIQPGMIRDINYGRPFKRFRPTPFLLGLFDKQADSRYNTGFQRVWLANNAARIPKDAAGVPLYAVGDTAIYLAASDTESTNRPYQVVLPSAYKANVFPTLNKFLDPFRASIQETRGSRDFLAFRLAETYLIAAEALFRDGLADQALPLINAVRTRAANPGFAAQMQYTVGQLSLDEILNERARELAGESMRWFDLVRTGKLVERVKLYNVDASPNIQPYHVLRPIPTAQIDRTSTPFPQNPGY
ncbi:MAG: RagB/SusD family nutrient uptake outer membrane protein [Gemmatimonadaceae bacterium]